MHKWQTIAFDVVVGNVSFAKSDAVTDVFAVRHIHVIHSFRTMIEVVAPVRLRPEWLFVIVTINAAIMRVTMKVVSTVRWFFVMTRRSPWHCWAPSYLSRYDYHYLSETGKRMMERDYLMFYIIIQSVQHFNKHF